MKDILIAVGVSIVATVGAFYVVRELETNFWRSKRHFENAKRSFNRKFKKATA